jgi:hypothetical protein
MYSVRDQVDERSGVPFGQENSERGVARGIRHEPELLDSEHARAAQALLARIRELHISGRTAEEIALQVLTTEPENAMFRAAMLVEIILRCACRGTKREITDYGPDMHGEIG